MTFGLELFLIRISGILSLRQSITPLILGAGMWPLTLTWPMIPLINSF